MAHVPDPGPPQTADTPGELVSHLDRVMRHYRQRMDHELKGLPGGMQGYRILAAVAWRDLPNQQAIGTYLSIDRTVLTYQIDALAAAQLVERIPAARDRRARKVVATNKGVAMLEKLTQRVADAEADLFAELTDAEAEAFKALAHRLAEATALRAVTLT
ncbi:MarR family transcriptional regulator [Streptomyces gilvifuscus]|uniref:MarR family transcriptional regulator n=1 Tax=Streptomyces gilvifuscus TaxID=1550617 RepID=A0ABT5G684_9ACTN|nr:MarR family transcriptional regulator [Streptomyces gilvifuscus]MDC2960382.1 MarR family transcriptional regulator [Streptomyces gilvifuscus]